MTTKQQPNNTQKHKITDRQTGPSSEKNKMHTQKETKPKLTGPSSPVVTAYMSVHITVYNYNTQYSTEQF